MLQSGAEIEQVLRHPGAGRDPEWQRGECGSFRWIPAFAGMT
jgi:hypothetical protein